MAIEPEILFIFGFMLLAFIWALFERPKPKKSMSPEEQKAYNEEMGRIKAQEQHEREEKIKKENEKERKRWLDILLGKFK